MNKKILLIILTLATITTIGFASAFYSTSSNIKNKFDTEDYNIKINGSGGTYKSSELVVNNGQTTLPTPTKNGYSFKGYSNSKDGDVLYSINIDNVEKINDKEIFAKYETLNYSLNYNLNNGSISGQKNSYTVEETFTLPTPTRNGYTFTGWTGTGLSGLTKSVTIQKGSTGNRSYTANWTANSYSISYNLNGGSASLKTSYNVEESFTLPTPTRNGYTFTGWTGTGLNGLTKNVTISKGSTGNRSYTANWSVNTYSISYNLNGGSASVKTNYNVEESFTLPIPTRAGYNFTGWTGTGLSSATYNVTVNKGNTGNRNYIANWQKYNTSDFGGIYLVSTRNYVTWPYTLDGYYNVGDTNVSSGNWAVTVDNYCVYIQGKTYPGTPYTYQFYVYKANNTSELLATGNASVPGNYQGRASATICW